MQDQRHEKFSGLGAIIQSEIWIALKEFGYRRESKQRAFKLIVDIDRDFREVIQKYHETKRAAMPGGEDKGDPAKTIEQLKQQQQQITPEAARASSKAL